MPYILALDQGTTSSRAIVFDHDGAIKAVAQKEFTQIFPNTGWVEHDPQEIWTSQIGVAVEALGAASLRPRDVAAIGITNQRETTIVWDRETGQPVMNAIVWQDRRTAEMCDRLRASGAEALVRERTGLVLDAYFSGTKVAWILDNVPGARASAEAGKLAFGTVDSWLVWNLSSGRLHLTDPSNASRTLLFIGADRIIQEVVYDAKDRLACTKNFIYGTKSGKSALVGVDIYDANGTLMKSPKRR